MANATGRLASSPQTTCSPFSVTLGCQGHNTGFKVVAPTRYVRTPSAAREQPPISANCSTIRQVQGTNIYFLSPLSFVDLLLSQRRFCLSDASSSVCYWGSDVVSGTCFTDGQDTVLLKSFNCLGRGTSHICLSKSWKVRQVPFLSLSDSLDLVGSFRNRFNLKPAFLLTLFRWLAFSMFALILSKIYSGFRISERRKILSFSYEASVLFVRAVPRLDIPARLPHSLFLLF